MAYYQDHKKIWDRLDRVANAFERIADALEKLADQAEPKIDCSGCKIEGELCDLCAMGLTDEPKTRCGACKWNGDKQVCGRCRNENLFAEDEPNTDLFDLMNHFEELCHDIRQQLRQSSAEIASAIRETHSVSEVK